MRKRFEVSEQQLEVLLGACKPTPCMFLSGGVRMGPTPQENANAAWCALGREMGFDGMTVQPTNEGIRIFTAEAY